MSFITTNRVKWDSEAEQLWWASRCQQSFWWFAREAYNIDGNKLGGWLSESVHKPLCDWFEGHAREWLGQRRRPGARQKNLLIVIPREFGKTTLITNAGMLWLQLQDPEMSIYIGSENKERAEKFFEPIKMVLDGSDPYQKFTQLYGNWFQKDRLWRSDAIVHAVRTGRAAQDPSFGIWGVETGLTGAHPDVLCLDDPNSYEKISKYADWLQVVNAHVSSLIPVLKGDGLRIFIGTRYGDADHIGTTLLKHKAKSVSGMTCPEVDASPEGIWDLYFLAARDLTNKPVYPEVWFEERLREAERDDNLKYHAQLLNDPASGTHVPLTRKQIDQCWVAKKDVPRNLRISVHVDTAFKYRDRQARGDESVITVWGHARDGSGDVYYLEGYGSFTWRAEDFNNKLVAILQRLRSEGRWPYVLTDEMELGGKSGTWELTLQSWCHAVNMPAPRIILIQRGGKRKITRLIEAASYWVDGHVKLVEGAQGVERLIDQMLKIGVSAHDDWSDPSADVFNKEVYIPTRLKSNMTQVEAVSPYDAELKTGTLTLRDLIDGHKNRGNRWGPTPPIE